MLGTDRGAGVKHNHGNFRNGSIAFTFNSTLWIMSTLSGYLIVSIDTTLVRWGRLTNQLKPVTVRPFI